MHRLKFLPFLIISLLTLFTSLAFSPKGSYADSTCSAFSTNPIQPWNTGADKNSLRTITIGGGLIPDTKYYIYQGDLSTIGNGNAASDGTITINIQDSDKGDLLKLGDHTISVRDRQGGSAYNYCHRQYTVKPSETLNCSLISSRNTGSSYGPGEDVWIEGTFWYIDLNGQQQRRKTDIDLRLWNKNNTVQGGQANGDHKDYQTDDLGNFKGNLLKIPAVDSTNSGWWTISVSKNNPSDAEKQLCTAPIYVSQTSGGPTSGSPPTAGGGKAGENPCKPNAQGVIECQTALGPIKTDPAEFIKTILGIATGLAGGIALIFMVIGSIKVLTSSGDQQKLNGGKDMIVAAVSGLLFLILSVLILRFIGSSILGGVPGLQ